MALQESGEMYLETILVLQKVNKDIRAIDIVNHTGYSKPSVSRAMGILKSSDYVTIAENGHITLTPEGKKIAERMYERHTMLTGYLMSLGVNEETATADACKIEHYISDETFQKIKEHAEKHLN